MERKKILNYRVAMARKIKPKLYLPFAGYFTEAHPSDRQLVQKNILVGFSFRFVVVL